MARAYSMDLRERVIQDADLGVASKDLAARYRVSLAWVNALKQRQRETGSMAPRVQTKFRSRVLAGHLDRLQAIVTAQPDRTLGEVQAALQTTASLTTIWRELGTLGLTLKKNRPRGRTAPG